MAYSVTIYRGFGAVVGVSTEHKTFESAMAEALIVSGKYHKKGPKYRTKFELWMNPIEVGSTIAHVSWEQPEVEKENRMSLLVYNDDWRVEARRYRIEELGWTDADFDRLKQEGMETKKRMEGKNT